MNIQFEQLYIENFMSFGAASVTFDNIGYTLVQGINQNDEDNSLSNGSGKSSLWEAISWVITGSTIRGNKDVTNLFGTDGALVELTFTLDNHHYILRRTKDHSKLKSSLTINIDGEDKSGKGIRESEEILNTILPNLTSELLGSVILLGQGLPDKLSSKTPSGRKELLEKLSKSDYMIEDIKDKISKRKDALNIEIRQIQDDLLKNKTLKERILSDLADIEKKQEASFNVEDLQKDLKQKETELESIQKFLDDTNKSFQETVIELTSFEQQKKSLENDLETISLKVSNQYQAELEKQKYSLFEVKYEIDRLQQEKVRLSSIRDTCPTCHQKLPGIIKPDFSLTDCQLSELQAQFEDIKNKIEDTENIIKLKIEEDSKSTKSKIKELNEEITQKQITSKQLESSLLENKFQPNILLQKINQIKLEIDTYEKNKFELNTRKQLLNEQVRTIETQILYDNNTEVQLQKHIDIVSQLNTLACRNFRGYLLSNIIDYIDNKMKEYAEKIFNHSEVQFILEGNALNIYYNKKQYEALSGGEKQKIDLIVQLALREMLSTSINFSSNILVLDEIFDSMDILSCQKVIDFISSELTNIKNIFIITHHNDLQIPCDNTITVVKDKNNVSRIL